MSNCQQPCTALPFLSGAGGFCQPSENTSVHMIWRDINYVSFICGTGMQRGGCIEGLRSEAEGIEAGA